MTAFKRSARVRRRRSRHSRQEAIERLRREVPELEVMEGNMILLLGAMSKRTNWRFREVFRHLGGMRPQVIGRTVSRACRLGLVEVNEIPGENMSYYALTDMGWRVLALRQFMDRYLPELRRQLMGARHAVQAARERADASWTRHQPRSRT